MKAPATISFVMHAALIGAAFVNLGFLDHREPPMGESNTGGQTATPVTLKEGIPMPRSAVENVLATDTKTLNPPEIAPKPEKKVEAPPPPAPITGKTFDIKGKDDEKKRLREMAMADLKQAKRAPETGAIPSNGGAVSTDMMRPNPSDGSGGIGFSGDFGTRYGWYVRGVRECLNRNWDRTRVGSLARFDPKVLVGFDIRKDGTVTAEHVTTSSNIAAFDQEALRTATSCAAGSAAVFHFPPLPTDFGKNVVSVEVWFDSKQ